MGGLGDKMAGWRGEGVKGRRDGEVERWRVQEKGETSRRTRACLPGWFAVLNQGKHNGGLILIATT